MGRRLTSSSPNHIFLKNLFLINRTVQKLILYIVEAKSCHRIRKPFAGDSFITEEQDYPFGHVDDFLLGSENLIKHASFGGFLAPASAYVDSVAGQGFRNCAKGALVDTASAVVALFWRDPDLPV